MIAEETSRRITSLRFLLAVLVVCIHNNFTAELIDRNVQDGAARIVFAQNGFSLWTQRLLSGGIALCAVPLFFLFAAYLSAKKNDTFSAMLAKKSRSLLLPYIAWFAVYALFYGPVKMLASRFLPSVFAHPKRTIFTQTAREWLEFAVGFFTGDGEGNPKFAGQFWFVRDLMILTLFSPLLIRAVKRFPAAVISLTAVFYVCGFVPVDSHAPCALFFFTAGIFWAEYDIDLFTLTDKIKWSEAALVFVLTFIFNYLDPFSTRCAAFFSACLTVASCVLVLKCSKTIESNSKAFELASRLSKYSFFLFAVHMPVLLFAVQKIWLCLFPMKNTFFCLAEYFCVSALIVLIGTASGLMLRKICPPLFSVFNGGRG